MAADGTGAVAAGGAGVAFAAGAGPEPQQVRLRALPLQSSRRGLHTRSVRLYGRCRRLICLVLWNRFRLYKFRLHQREHRLEPAPGKFAMPGAELRAR